MCKLKSGIALKSKIHVAEHDSHSDMLEELGIKDDYLGASKIFVRWELSPADGDPFSDIDTWTLKIDQDIIPDWFSKKEYRPKIVEAVKEWAKTHIFVGIDVLKLNTGTNYYIKDCKNVEIRANSTVTAWSNSTVTAWNNSTVEARSNSTVTACDNSTVKAYANSTVEARSNSTVTACDNSTVKAYANSTVKAYDNSKVTACDNSKVDAYDNSTVTAWSNSTVTACDNSTVKNSPILKWNKQDSLILSKNATFKDSFNKVIYQAGDYKLLHVESGKSLEDQKGTLA